MFLSKNEASLKFVDFKINVFTDIVLRILILIFAVSALVTNTDPQSYIFSLFVLIFSIIELTVKAIFAIEFYCSNYVVNVHEYTMVATEQPPEETMY